MSTNEIDRMAYAVLYVDDEEQALKYFRKGLEKDFRILTATSVAAAMAILEKEAATIGVVISDQRMPGKSGVTMLTEIRQRWPAIVRILVTAYTDIDSAIASVNAGAVYKYINKPADFPLLRQVLTEALAMHRETLYRDAMAQTLRELQEQKKATELAEAQREQLQRKLVEASRQAGRAEVATGILHNVGNVLNSMNVAAGVVHHTLEQSRIANLCKALTMLESHSNDLASFITADERGQRLPSYLSKLAGVLHEEHAAISQAMATLNRNIEHIANIVRQQQSHAREVTLAEPVDPADLMDEALRMNEAKVAEHGIKVVREYAKIPVLLLDQHRVLQILVNFVSNAISALTDQSIVEKRIVLKVSQSGEGPAASISFSVTDNGSGIEQANLTKIFSYGFTTRCDGHGFGLHSSANAAREMGGSLLVASDGPGRGATFTLQFPQRAAGEELPSARLTTRMSA